MAIYRFQNAKRTKEEFTGRRKGHEYQITLEPDTRWYIMVWAPDGCLVYDGWWRNSEGKSMNEAIAEAVRGADYE